MSLNDTALLTFGFNLLEQDGGGLDEGWEEDEPDDELEGFEVEHEDGVLVEDDYNPYQEAMRDIAEQEGWLGRFVVPDDDDEAEFYGYYEDDDYWEVDDGPESTSEADPE